MDGPGRPAVQSHDQPAPGFYVSQTKLEDRNFAKNDQRRYVDATRYPYIALPQRMLSRIGYLQIGDFAVVFNVRNSRFCNAIYADVKNLPVFEGSVALADSLGLPPSPINGGTSHRQILCLVFPGSGFGQGFIPGLDTLRHTAAMEYSADWKTTLADCYGEYSNSIKNAAEVICSSSDF